MVYVSSTGALCVSFCSKVIPTCHASMFCFFHRYRRLITEIYGVKPYSNNQSIFSDMARVMSLYEINVLGGNIRSRNQPATNRKNCLPVKPTREVLR